MATRGRGLCNSAWAAESRCPALRPQISITDRSDHARHTKRLLQLRRHPDRGPGGTDPAGICHCTTCRKESGGPFMAFAVWHADHVKIEGRTASWKATRDDRHFCPFCGRRCSVSRKGPKRSRSGWARLMPHRRTWCRPMSYGFGDGSGGFRCCRAGSSLRGIGRRWGRGIRAGAEPQNHRFVPSTIACNPDRTEKLAIGLIASATHGNPTRTAPPAVRCR